jgi:hypothetical protein
MPGVSNAVGLPGYQAAGILSQMCKRGAKLWLDWPLCV